MEEINIKLSGEDAQKDEKVNLSGGLDVQGILEKYNKPIILALLGGILITGGVFAVYQGTQSEDKVEIISSDNTSKISTIYADIAGGVINPGIYELKTGSRLDDLLIKAGGLAANADRDWIEKNLNRAQKLTDGQKVYIPEKKSTTGITSTTSTTSNTGGQIAGSSWEAGKEVPQETKININTASSAELDTLYGVGPATAQKIIDNRPYGSIDELVSKKVLSKTTFEKIREKISVY